MILRRVADGILVRSEPEIAQLATELGVTVADLARRDPAALTSIRAGGSDFKRAKRED